MELIEALNHFWLSQKEAKVYLAGLELGTTTATNTSIKSNIATTRVSDLLEKLIELGLTSYAIKNNKKYFTMANPNELSKILEEKQEIINNIIPKLEEIQKTPGIKRPQVEVYEGKDSNIFKYSQWT